MHQHRWTDKPEWVRGSCHFWHRRKMPMLRARTIARAALVLVLVAACVASNSALADITICGDCTSTPGAQSAQSGLGGNNVVCANNAWQYPAYQHGDTSASCNSTNAGI